MSNEASDRDILKLDSITLRRGDRIVLDELSLVARPGDRIVIRGDNGSGKTSLLRAVLGLLSLESGRILLDGREVGTRPWRDVRRLAAWMPQEGVLHRFPVAAGEVVAVGTAGERLSRTERKRRIEAAMEAAGASHLADRCYHRLSGGERRRISVARCLAQGARILLLDEPSAALDAESRERLVRLIERLPDQTVVAVTHEEDLFSNRRWTHRTLAEGRLC